MAQIYELLGHRRGSGRRKPRQSTRDNIKRRDVVCRYCMLAPAETVDHVVPWHMGGRSTVTNLVGCCVSCNERKDGLPPRLAGMKLHLPLRFFEYMEAQMSGDPNYNWTGEDRSPGSGRQREVVD